MATKDTADAPGVRFDLEAFEANVSNALASSSVTADEQFRTLCATAVDAAVSNWPGLTVAQRALFKVLFKALFRSLRVS